jgi:mRNA interferase MazF
MEEGAIVKVAFQQSDRLIKFRPAVLIKKVPPFDDLLVCAVSTQIQNSVTGLDIVIKESDPDFSKTRLKQSSVIRVGKLATIPAADVEGQIGSIGIARYQQLINQLSRFLK